MLTKTRKVMDRVGSSEVGAVVFIQWDEDNAGVIRCMATLPHADWVEMGEPEQITISAEPGDQLNVQGS